MMGDMMNQMRRMMMERMMGDPEEMRDGMGIEPGMQRTRDATPGMAAWKNRWTAILSKVA